MTILAGKKGKNAQWEKGARDHIGKRKDALTESQGQYH